MVFLLQINPSDAAADCNIDDDRGALLAAKPNMAHKAW